jgi:hypothetical protein
VAPPVAYQLDELAATANMIRDNYNPVNYNGHPSAAPTGVEGGAGAGVEGAQGGVEGGASSPTKNFSVGPPGGTTSGGAGGGGSNNGGGGGKELISNNVQRKTSSASLSFTSTQHLPNSHNNNVEQSSTASSAHAGGKGASLKGDVIKEVKNANSSSTNNSSSNPSNSSSNSTNNNNDSSTYTYKDYANVEDPTTKIINEYADRGVQGSIISHEDETTKNLMQQKLPAKLAAMLSDPGE